MYPTSRIWKFSNIPAHMSSSFNISHFCVSVCPCTVTSLLYPYTCISIYPFILVYSCMTCIHKSIDFYIYMRIFTYGIHPAYSYIHISKLPYIHVFIYSFIHIFMYSYIQICTHSYVNILMYPYTNTSMYLCIHISIYPYIHIFIHSNIHKFIFHIFICPYIYTSIHS